MSRQPLPPGDIADRLLLHILDDPELLSSLLGRSGLAPSQLREVLTDAQAPEFILDFVTESDDRVISCADAIGVTPEQIGMAARISARRD